MIDDRLHEVYKKSGLGKWFHSQSAGGDPGWDRYNTKGEKVGKCGDSKEGDPYAACLSKQKADKLGKKGIANFVKRKRKAQKDSGDKVKGKQKSKGQEPVSVKTDPKNESVNESKPKDWDQYYKNMKKKLKDAGYDLRKPISRKKAWDVIGSVAVSRLASKGIIDIEGGEGRKTESVNEKREQLVAKIYPRGAEIVDGIADPSSEELNRVLYRSKYQKLRYILDLEKDKLIVWDANDSIHDQVGRGEIGDNWVARTLHGEIRVLQSDYRRVREGAVVYSVFGNAKKMKRSRSAKRAGIFDMIDLADVVGSPMAEEGMSRVRLGDFAFDLEIADGFDEIELGLSGRASVPSSTGMLFILPREEHVSFWMKDCLVDLDLVYLNSSGVITQIEGARCEPRREGESDVEYEARLTNYDSYEPVKYVIEVPYGEAFNSGAMVGDVVGLPIFEDESPSDRYIRSIREGSRSKDFIIIKKSRYVAKERMIDALINPRSESQIRNFVKRTKYKEARFLMDEKGKLWVWDGEDALHDDAISSLDLRPTRVATGLIMMDAGHMYAELSQSPLGYRETTKIASKALRDLLADPEDDYPLEEARVIKTKRSIMLMNPTIGEIHSWMRNPKNYPQMRWLADHKSKKIYFAPAEDMIHPEMVAHLLDTGEPYWRGPDYEELATEYDMSMGAVTMIDSSDPQSRRSKPDGSGDELEWSVTEMGKGDGLSKWYFRDKIVKSRWGKAYDIDPSKVRIWYG